MAAGHDAEQAGERVEALLAELASHAGPQVAATAEELVSCLVELYGAGLGEIVRIIGEDAVQNTPIFEENPPENFKGIDIVRAVRSFDPCLPCGVHMYLGGGKVLKTSHSPTGVTLAV